MATILLKKRDTTGAPGAGDLTNSASGAEVAVNTFDKRLYSKDSGGNVVELGINPTSVTTGALTATGTTTLATSLTGIAKLSSGVVSSATAGTDYAKPDTASTWSAAQTFNSTNLKLAGSTSGTTTLNASATAGTTTLTLPAVTDTVAVLGTAQSFTKAQRGSIVTLTDGATITPDFADGNNYTVTLGGNRTLANPTNLTAGQSGSIFVVQDATGSRTLAYGSYWDFSGGTAPTLTTTANAIDRIDYVVRSTTSIHAVFTANYS